MKYDGPYQDMFGFVIHSPGVKTFALGDREELKKDPKKNRKGIAIDKELLLEGLLEDVQARWKK